MDLTRGQRNAVFALIVIVLAALGYYLVVPALTHSHRGGQATAPPTAAGQASSTAPAPAAPAASPAAPQAVNIYSWLPFSQQDLAAAASVTVRFSVDYDTFTYAESASGYVGRMAGLVTGQLRTGQKQVSTGTAVIDSLRAFGPSSMTFAVTAGQHLVSSHGTTSGSTQYAVTVTGTGGSWRVSDIELESSGNS